MLSDSQTYSLCTQNFIRIEMVVLEIIVSEVFNYKYRDTRTLYIGYIILKYCLSFSEYPDLMLLPSIKTILDYNDSGNYFEHCVGKQNFICFRRKLSLGDRDRFSFVLTVQRSLRPRGSRYIRESIVCVIMKESIAKVRQFIIVLAVSQLHRWLTMIKLNIHSSWSDCHMNFRTQRDKRHSKSLHQQLGYLNAQ